MEIYLSLLVALIAAIVYLITDKPKVSRLSEISFFCGLFAFLINVSKIFTIVAK